MAAAQAEDAGDDEDASTTRALDTQDEEAPPATVSTMFGGAAMATGLKGCVMVSKKRAKVRSGGAVIEVERHAALRVVTCDGDGNEIDADGEEVCVVLEDKRIGWIDRASTREPDELDDLASAAGERWVRLASAIRTDNAAKMEAYVETKAERNGAAVELIKRARERMARVALTKCLEHCDDMELDEVRKVRAAAEGVLDRASIEKLERRGRWLADVGATFGDPDSASLAVQEGAMLIDVPYLRDVLSRCPGYRDAVEHRLSAATRVCEEEREGAVHAIYVEHEAWGGHYARVVDSHGRQRTGDKFRTYVTRRGKHIFAHIYHPRRAFVADGRGSWRLFDDYERDESAKHRALTMDLTDPEAYTPQVDTVRVTTVDTLARARQIEGDIYMGLKDYEQAIGQYTSAIEFAPELRAQRDAAVFYLNRAQARAKLGTLPQLRAGLVDLDEALRLDPDDSGSPRVFLERARIAALLDDIPAAKAHLRIALDSGDDAGLRAEAAPVRKLIRDRAQPTAESRAFALKALGAG